MIEFQTGNGVLVAAIDPHEPLSGVQPHAVILTKLPPTPPPSAKRRLSYTSNNNNNNNNNNSSTNSGCTCSFYQHQHPAVSQCTDDGDEDDDCVIPYGDHHPAAITSSTNLIRSSSAKLRGLVVHSSGATGPSGVRLMGAISGSRPIAGGAADRAGSHHQSSSTSGPTTNSNNRGLIRYGIIMLVPLSAMVAVLFCKCNKSNRAEV